MYDIFLTEDVRKLMKRKSIVFLGDSNVRALYKDFLCLLKDSKFIPQHILRNKMEKTVYGDELVSNGKRTNGRNYREEREASINGTNVSYFFLTKVYDNYVEDVLKKITSRSKPDVIIINSCLWDITRWGCDGVYYYKNNLKFLMKEFRKLVPNCLVIWVTTPPLAGEMKGGFLVKELQFLKYSLRFHVVEANHFARKVVADNGFDVLDTHFHLQMQIHRRSRDGIHWEPKAVRYITNLILRHISLSWDVPLPHRYESTVIDENLAASLETESPMVRKITSEKTAVDAKQVHSKDSAVSEPIGKLQSTVTVEKKSKNAKKKRRSSIPLYKVPKREESIHSYMTKAEKRARRRRIQKWKRTVLGDSPQSCAPSFSHNSGVGNLIHGKQDQSLEADLFNNSFNISEIPLPPYSPGHPQPNGNPTGMSECQLPPSNRSVHFNFPFVTDPSQTPCPPYNPHYNQLDYAPPERRVVDCQTTNWSSSGFTNGGNRGASYSRSAVLNRRASQRRRMFAGFNNFAVPHEFPHVIPGQILKPRYDFVHDEIPEVYLF